jgi:hypothetical protein
LVYAQLGLKHRVLHLMLQVIEISEGRVPAHAMLNLYGIAARACSTLGDRAGVEALLARARPAMAAARAAQPGPAVEQMCWLLEAALAPWQPPARGRTRPGRARWRWRSLRFTSCAAGKAAPPAAPRCTRMSGGSMSKRCAPTAAMRQRKPR